MVYALLGLAFLVVARVLGLEQVPIFRALGRQDIAIRGKGLPAYHGGNAVLLVAFLAAFLQALVRLSSPDQLSVLSIVTLAITTGVSVAAIWLVPSGPWRRLYATSSVALAAATATLAPIDAATFVGRIEAREGVAYVWGGETRLGLDCSGLIRIALLDTYLRDLRPGAALRVWLFDTPARNLPESYHGMFGEGVSHASIEMAQHDESGSGRSR